MKDLEGQIETANKGREEAIKQLRKLQVRVRGLEECSSTALYNLNIHVDTIACICVLKL